MEIKGYKIKNKLGEGNNGTVYLVKTKNGDNCVLKVIGKEYLEDKGNSLD